MSAFNLPEAEILAKPVQPDAAIAFWQSRAAMTRADAATLEEGARWRAFFVTGLAQQGMVQDVKDALGAALESGGTFRDFKARIADVVAAQNWQGDRIETIFRNNMQTAYMAGRWTKAQASKKNRPYGRYMTVGDDNVRPRHEVLHGKVYPLDHPFWDENTPPNGHKCRCYFRTLSERQVKRMGLTVETEMPGDSMWTDPATGMEVHVARPGADDGWRSNPGKNWLGDLTTYAAGRLEQAEPDVAAAMVRRYVSGGLDAWMQNPEGVFPLVALPPEDAEAVGLTSTIGRLSPKFWAQQKRLQPELTVQDYALAQDAVEKGRRIRQAGDNFDYALDLPGGDVLLVTPTWRADELYVTGLRRLSRDEAKRRNIVDE